MTRLWASRWHAPLVAVIISELLLQFGLRSGLLLANAKAIVQTVSQFYAFEMQRGAAPRLMLTANEFLR